MGKRFEIPLLPHVAIKVIRLSGEPNVSMQDLAKVILTDQGIATRILQIANSPVYAASVEITTISQALVRLGQTEVKNLMLAISMQGKVFKSASYQALARQLWEHSIGTAFAARVTANALRMEKEEAFLCGLMHDMGKMVLLNVLERSQRMMIPTYAPSGELIRSIVHQYHADVGEMVAKAWELPEHVSKAIRMVPRAGEMESLPKDIAVVAVGNDICEIRGVGPDRVEKSLHESPGAKALSLSEGACEELMRRFDQTFEQVRGAFL